MALQHRGTAQVELAMQRLDNSRMIMSGIMDTVSGEKIEDHLAIAGIEFASRAAREFPPHLQQLKQSDPLRVDMIDIGLLGRADPGRCHVHKVLRAYAFSGFALRFFT